MKRILLKGKWFFAALIVLIIAEPSLNSVLNFWVQKLFNAASPGVSKVLLLQMLTQGFLLWMGKRLIAFSLGTVKARYICQLKYDVKHSIFTHLMGMETSSLAEVASSGEYLSLFFNDLYLLETRYFNQLISLIGSVFSLIILGSSFLALNTFLSTAIMLFGMATAVVPLYFSRRLNQKNLAYSSTISRFTQRLKEFIVAYPTIKNYAVNDIVSRRFDDVNTQTENAKFDADFELNLANSVGQLIAWFMQFIAVGLGLMMVANGQIMVGTVIAAQGFANDLGSPLQNLVISINSIRSVREIVRKMERMSGQRDANGMANPAAGTASGLQETPPADYTIDFRHVNLTLQGQQVLKDFTFRFEDGKKYLVIGRNGSGKSSVFKLLKNWFSRTNGDITIGGKELASYSEKECARIISYLNENVSLFSGTVRENITLFAEKDEQKLRDAISDAHVELNLNKEIRDEGRNISSGEQRRIEIARSLLSTAHILVFDEVVSTLDIDTAYEIEKLALSLNDKTIIFVSHNFSGKLIRQYDEILIMDHGQLIDHGRYEELLARSPYFTRICEIKFGIADSARIPAP